MYAPCLSCPEPRAKYAPLRVHAGQRARGDAVAVDVEVARELLDRSRAPRRSEHLAAIGTIAVVPREPLAHPVVHADVEIPHDEHRRLKTLGEVERRRRSGRSTPPDSPGKSTMCFVSPCDTYAIDSRSPCCVRVGMPVDGPVR